MESARLTGVPALRLSVWPRNQKGPPQSFAVAARPAWKRAASRKLPLSVRWKRAAPSRWEIDFHLSKAAPCFGLGENCSARLNLRGRSWTLFATDDPLHVETMDAMYKSIPFLIVFRGSRSLGLFLDSPACQRWDLDESLRGRGSVQLLSRRGWQLHLLGPAPLPDLVRAYTELTGRAALPPLWSLGHQQSRWSYPDEKTVKNIAREFRRRKIPCDTIVLDIDFMEGYRVFTHSRRKFPRFKKMIGELARDDFRVVTIVDPGVKQDPKYRVFAEGRRKGCFCKTSRGQVFIDRVWPGKAAFPDFLRADVRGWWGRMHQFYLDNGVSGIWNDMNEPAMFDHMKVLARNARELPPDSKQLFIQQTPEGRVGHFEVRNLYGFQMSRATREGLAALRPNERAFVLTRSAYAGVQRYAAVWLGDNMSWFEHLKSSVPMLINMGLSGVPFCGVDIGGFGGDCYAELLLRWYAVGIFYPFFRNHCALGWRAQEPWAFGSEVEAHCRKFIETRYRLLPYIQSLFWEHARTGAPLIRPLSWHHPDDKAAVAIDDQFLFGSDLLVAPVLERTRVERSVYFPRGLWHPWGGGRPFQGGCTHIVRLGLGDVPAFVRDGAILPLSDVVQSTAALRSAPVSFTCFGSTCRGVYFEDDGKNLDYERGVYNEWKLSLTKGRFTARAVHRGYAAPSRRFRVHRVGRARVISISTDRSGRR